MIQNHTSEDCQQNSPQHITEGNKSGCGYIVFVICLQASQRSQEAVNQIANGSSGRARCQGEVRSLQTGEKFGTEAYEKAARQGNNVGGQNEQPHDSW